MKHILATGLLLATVGVAAAQPAPGAPMPPQPMPPQPQPMPPQPQPQPGYPPQPGYAPQPYVYAPPSLRDGLTFEANLGLGIFRVSSNGNSDSESGIGGLNLGIGGFVNRRLAVTLRAAGVTYSENGGSLTQAFLGPSAQYFVNDNAFIGGGIGLGIVRLAIDGAGSDSETGFALDLRAGYTFNPGSKHSFNASIEITPAFIEDVEFTGIAFLAGYQLQ